MGNAPARLRELLARPGALIAPGAYDPLTAKIAEWAGFEAVYMTGSGAEAAVLGKPDLGYLSLAEASTHAGNMAKAVNIPLVADADVGFGGALNAARTVQEFESKGVSGIHIEDQSSPKRCALVGGVNVLPRDEFLGKIKAAVDARQNPDFLIIARTDSYESMGLKECVDRANACVAVGAEMVFVAGMIQMSDEERVQLPKLIKAPLLAPFGPPGAHPSGVRPHIHRPALLAEMGFKLLVSPITSLLVATKAVMDLMTEFKRSGDLSSFGDRALSFDAFDEFIGLRATIRKAVEEYGEPVTVARN